MIQFIDSHIHLDLYEEDKRLNLMSDMLASIETGMFHESSHSFTEPYCIKALLSVSMNLESCQRNLVLKQQYPNVVVTAFGYHPEQPVPSAESLNELLAWIERHNDEMAAIGEIGLPYYTKTEMEDSGYKFDLQPYIDLLEQFLLLAVKLDKPVVLHAVYEDADIACDLLEKHNIRKAHFHWYKGSLETTERMIRNGYFISITPDVLYEKEIQQLAAHYPLEQMMVETDGPWPFEGPFANRFTHPSMMVESVQMIAQLKQIPPEKAAEALFSNAVSFYGIK